MEKYIITCTNEYGDAVSPVILTAKNISDAVKKFQSYVLEQLRDAYSDIESFMQENDTTDINELFEELDEYDIDIDDTCICMNTENDNGDARTEWNLYSMADLTSITE